MQLPVFVIDDDFAVRDGLVMLLRSEGMRARGFAGGTEFFANLPLDPIACVITDLRMPDIDGIEVSRRVEQLRGKAWPVIVITGHGDVSSAVAAMKAGVADLLEKPFAPEALLQALTSSMHQAREAGSDMEARAAVEARLARLTNRESQVFLLLTDGLANKEIAVELSISPRTVEIFRAKMMTKMMAPNLSALIRMRLGLV
jgi:two-component system response regulator FixJ